MFETSALLESHGVQAVFSDRHGGCSPAPFDSLNLGLDVGDCAAHVANNLQQLCAVAGLGLPHQARQVHGTQVMHCSGMGQQHDIAADILLANTPQVAVAVRTADCLPILLTDPQAKVIAAVHAGWRGTVNKVVQRAVAEMVALGAKPPRMVASLGACISGCCFAVAADVAQQLAESCGQDVSQLRDGQYFADLSQANGLQLQQSGVRQLHIESNTNCTVCNQNPRYFSYRRDAGQTGRQLAVISL